MTEKNWASLCEEFDGPVVALLAALDWMLVDKSIPRKVYESYTKAVIKNENEKLTQAEVDRIYRQITKALYGSSDLKLVKFLALKNREEVDRELKQARQNKKMVVVYHTRNKVIGLQPVEMNRWKMLGYGAPRVKPLTSEQVFSQLYRPSKPDEINVIIFG